MRSLHRTDHPGLEGTLFARILHAYRERRSLLAFGGYHLDLSVPIAVPDQPSLLRIYVGTCDIPRFLSCDRSYAASIDISHGKGCIRKPWPLEPGGCAAHC